MNGLKAMPLVVTFIGHGIHGSLVHEANFAKSPGGVGQILGIELLQHIGLHQVHLTNPGVYVVENMVAVFGHSFRGWETLLLKLTK